MVNVIMKISPYLEVFKVHYHTNLVKIFEQYINHPKHWTELCLDDLITSVHSDHWDLIIVTTKHLAFVNDCDGPTWNGGWRL